MSEELFEKRCEKLNEQQKKAVDTIEGPVLVVAGPGSGKTEILSLRVANILKETDTPSHGILCLTFTDAAAVNMRKRLEQIVGADSYRVAIHTFHNFSTHIIDRWPEHFYKGAFFRPADSLLQMEVLEGIFSSLSHDNPLSSTHPEQGFVYQGHAQQAIGALKKAGLSPSEFRAILKHNKQSIEHIAHDLDLVMSATMSKKNLDRVASLLTKMMEYPSYDFPVLHIRPLLPSLAHTLEHALSESIELGKTTSLSEWKKKHTKKDGVKRILSAEYYAEKMTVLADIYEAYQTEMHRRGYFDFDDMLLDVISALEHNEHFKHELQEQFLYILVDEFQDTNDAQMRLLHLLSDNPVSEGRPNIMAVGDDDQAIYKFQGAEIGNILSFKDRYREPEIITMTDNYRSTQDILDVARDVIVRGSERLENLIPEMQKQLTSSNKTLKKGSIEQYLYPTRIHEYDGVASRIEEALERGTEPEEIAVIARRHRDLESLVPFLHERGIPISYERQQNVLTEPHVRELIVMSRFVASLGRKDSAEADEYLPEILSFPFWNISRRDIWELSIEANRERKLWLELLLDHENPTLSVIGEFFLELGARAQHEPVEYILEALIGAHVPLAADTADGEASDEKMDEEEHINEVRPRYNTFMFVSPYKEYYFSRKSFGEKKTEYLRFLSSLKTFIEAIREYKSGALLKIDDLVEFVDIHENNNLLVTDTSPFSNADEAVNLLTAHKAKGLEYDTVFVLSCQDSIWAKSHNRNLLPFPANLPIRPAGDTTDDAMRLFYVALTRAKRHLYLSWYQTDDNGKESLPVHFLSGQDLSDVKEVSDSLPDTHALLETTVPGYHKPPFVKDEQALLKPLVENYQLSVTHLTNFLDVSRGGPQTFLEQNLLRFPQPKSLAGVYGSVIHSVLNRLYVEYKKTGSKPTKKDVLSWYADLLSKQRLSDRDYEFYLKRGNDNLDAFYTAKQKAFNKKDFSEFNFKHQGVKVGNAHLTGKIDRIAIDGEDIHVYDYKTGKAEEKWKDNDIKLWKYKTQLVFYKILIENSREFRGKGTVKTGTLEFVESLPSGSTAGKHKIVDLVLEIGDEDVRELTQIIQAVYTKIKTLEFPDTSGYSADMKGIREFMRELMGM